MFARTATAATASAADHGGALARAGLMQRLGALLKPHRCGPIGLEIATEKLHMVQFEIDSNPPSIRAAISLPYSGEREALLADPKQLKALVRRALASKPFHGRSVVSCLPASDVQTMTLSYKRGPGQSDADAIVGELRERIKAEIEQSVVDYVAIRGDDGEAAERSAIVAVADRRRVLAYLEALRAAGLDALALDIGPSALARLVSSLGHGAHYANALLINFGRGRSYMSVMWGRRLMLDRELEFGENRLVERLAGTLNMPEASVLQLLYERGFSAPEAAGADSALAEAVRTVCEVLRPEFATLAAEVNKTLIYTASKTRGQSVERIHLLGSVARYPGVAALLQGLVSVPVEVVNPLNVFPVRPGAAVTQDLDPIAGIGLATGLALREVAVNG